MMKLWTFLTLFSVLFAQNVPALPTPIYQAEGDAGIRAPTVFWSPDSTKLYFTADYARLTDQGYSVDVIYQYDLTTKQTSEVDTPGYLINLTDEQQTHFHADNKRAFIAPNQQDFVYRSTFQVYARGEGHGGYVNLLAVGNLEQGDFLPIRNTDRYGSMSVRWSEDSSAFTIEERGDTTSEALIYVHGEKTAPWTFDEFSEVYIGALEGNQTIDDISPDGQRLLFPRIDNGHLYLWDVREDSSYWIWSIPGREVPIGKPIGAAFSLTDDDKIMVVGAQGITLNGLSRASYQMINRDINSTWANFASFSPDNQWVALLADGNILNRQLYVMPVDAAEAFAAQFRTLMSRHKLMR